MNRVAILITLFLLYCSTTQAQTYVMRHGKKIYLTSETNAKEAIDDIWAEKKFYVPVHDSADFGVPGTEITGNFNAYAAMFKIFPGRHLYISSENDGKSYEAVAVWRCRDMCRRWVVDDMDNRWFSGKQRYFTKVSNVVPFKDDSGRRFVYVVFEHNAVTGLGPALYVGVGASADAGIALFAQKSNKWVLTNFALYAGSFGTYKKLAADPHVIKLGQGNYGLEIVSRVNGPGGPSFENTYLYAPVGQVIKQIYSDLGSSVWDFNGRCSSWNASLMPQKGNDRFNDLHVVIDGDFCTPKMAGGIYEDIDTVGHAPDEVFFKTKVADSFGYKITKLYHFDGEKYKWQRTYYKTFAVKPKATRQ